MEQAMTSITEQLMNIIDEALFLNCRRMGWVDESRFNIYFWPGVTLATVAVPLATHWGFPIQGLVGFLILVLVVQEAILFFRNRAATYALLLAAMGFGLVAATASAMDLTRVWCDPENHFLQGHAIWHVFNSAAIYCYARFFATGCSLGRTRVHS